MRKEGDKITSLELKALWAEYLSLFDDFIASGNKVRPIQFLIRHIIDKGYNAKFYPGSSLFDLLISIPANGYNKLQQNSKSRVR